MRSSHRFIIYIFIFLLVIASGVLYFMRSEAAKFLSENAGIAKTEINNKLIATTTRDSLDVGIFKSAKFLSLKNNISKFDFDAVCKVPVGRIDKISTTSEGAITTSTQIISCIVGNNTPFPLATNNPIE